MMKAIGGQPVTDMFDLSAIRAQFPALALPVNNQPAVFLDNPVSTQDHPAIHTVVNARGSMVIDVDGNQLDAIYLDQTGAVRDHFRIVKSSPCHFAAVHPNTDHTQPALCDGDVDIADISLVASCWDQTVSATCPVTLDIGGTGGVIDLYDIAAIAGEWGWSAGNS